MIAIAAYNSLIYVKSLLNSMSTSLINEDVLIVCTCPKQTYFIDEIDAYLTEVKYPFKVTYTVTPYSGYDTGAYVWAYQNYKDDYYIFLHDTLVVNNSNWFERFKSFRNENTLNAWCYFNLYPIAPMYSEFIFPKIEDNTNINTAHLGIFGPIFQISRNSLSRIDAKYDLRKFIPTNKVEQEAMERGWSLLAAGSGVDVNVIDGHYGITTQHYKDMSLTKFITNRQ